MNLFFKKILATDFTDIESVSSFLEEEKPVGGSITYDFHSFKFLELCKKMLGDNLVNKIYSDYGYSQETVSLVHSKVIIAAEPKFRNLLQRIKMHIDQLSNRDYIIDFQGLDFLEEVANVINKINYHLRLENVGNDQFRVKILPNFETMDSFLYFMLMQFIDNNEKVLRCTFCNEYIVDPTPTQLSNYRNYGVITHSGECREQYKLEKDNKRNKLKYRNKKSEVN